MTPDPKTLDGAAAWLHHRAQAEADALQDDGFTVGVMATLAAQAHDSTASPGASLMPAPTAATVTAKRRASDALSSAWTLYPMALALAVMGGLAALMLSGAPANGLVGQPSPWSSPDDFMAWVAGLVLSAWCAWTVWSTWRHGSLASAVAPAP